MRLHVGVLQRLDRSVFDQAFALIGDGTVAEGAAVEVVDVAVGVRCRDCRATRDRRRADHVLPGCGGHDLELTAGDDLVLESITLADRDAPVRDGQEVG